MQRPSTSTWTALWLRRPPLFVILAILLGVGCNGGQQAPESERPLAAGKADPAYVATVPLEPGDKVEDVERAFGGDVLVWRPGRFAVVGLTDAGATRLRSGALRTLSDGATLEADDDAFLGGGVMAWMNGTSKLWDGGTSKLWDGGTSKLWDGGTSKLWSDGQYRWMPENTAQWQQIGLEEGHNLAPNLGYGVKVAVVDTGVDLEHPALSEALAPIEEWWDFYDDDAQPQEVGVLGEGGFGHGTNVAGIVRQVAPRATILPLRVLGPDGGGDVADVAAAIAWAVDMGADVINLSLGGDGISDAVEAAIRSATAEGVLVVASTGNTGDTSVTYPATEAATQVAGWRRLSVTSLDVNDVKSDFATFGSVVELAAPGEDVYGPAPEGRVAAWSGTSMAAPMASGALALALGERSRLKVPAGDLADELRHRAYHDIYNNLNTDYQHLLGRGRLDLVEFLRNAVEQ